MSSPDSTPQPLTGPSSNFHVTLIEAARRLGITPDAVADLVRAGHLGAYAAPLHEVSERPPLRFCEESLATVHAALYVPDAPVLTAHPELRAVGTLHAVASALREYLATRAPSDSAEIAESTGAPLLSKARSGVIYTHARTEQVAALAREAASGRVRVRLATDSAVADALRRLGCQQLRGIRSISGDRQSWKSWWRVPLSVWSIESADLVRIDDFPALGGIREDDVAPPRGARIERPTPWLSGDAPETRDERVAAERERAEREGPDLPLTPHRARALLAVDRGEVSIGEPGDRQRWLVSALDDRHRKGVLRACTQLFDAGLIELSARVAREMVLTERGRRHLERAREEFAIDLPGRGDDLE